MKSLLYILKALFPFLFSSKLGTSEFSARRVSVGELMNMLGTPAFAGHRHGFRPPFRTNGASRRKKTNRLHQSTKTRNKHR
jgi:hypothetical protein